MTSTFSCTFDIPFKVCFLVRISKELITPSRNDDLKAFNIQKCPTTERGKHARGNFHEMVSNFMTSERL